MNKDQLILKAKELGIDGAETLTVKQLDDAIKLAEEKAAAENAAAEKRTALVEFAATLGIEVTDDQTEEEINTLVLTFEFGSLQEKFDAVVSALGLGSVSELTTDELTAKVAEKLQVKQPEEVKAKEPKGKTEKTFKSQNGKTYGFAPDAPAAFRYLGKKLTQKEWIDDKDSMEIMISGNLNFVQQVKK